MVWTSAIAGRTTAFWMKRRSFLEQKLATTPEAMKQTFEVPRSLMALETGHIPRG